MSEGIRRARFVAAVAAVVFAFLAMLMLFTRSSVVYDGSGDRAQCESAWERLSGTVFQTPAVWTPQLVTYYEQAAPRCQARAGGREVETMVFLVAAGVSLMVTFRLWRRWDVAHSIG